MPTGSTQKAIRANRVFTTTQISPIQDGVVILDGETITRAARYDDVKEELKSAGTKVLDYGDATIMPGMVDAHCHMTLAGDARTYEQMTLDPDEMMSLVSLSNLQRHLASGVTTVRDNGGRNRIVFVVREAAKRGYILAPRMLLSGRPITHSYGHFYWCNGVADSEDEIRTAVRTLVAEGADHIKIMASGGATAGNIPYYPSYTQRELSVAVDAAHALGRLTTAHCRAKDSMTWAAEAGLDCIEHGEFLVPGELIEFGGGVASSGRMVYDPAVAAVLAQHGQFISFTMQAGGYDTLLALRERFETSPAHLDPQDRGRLSALEAYYDMKLEVFARLREEGFTERLVISSDAGPFDTSFSGLQHGMELAAKSGMPTHEILNACTSVAAQACGVGDTVGSLQPGFQADIVVVDGDPLTDIKAMRSVKAVYLAGRLVAPQVAHSGIDTERITRLDAEVPSNMFIDC